jgi:hypothetical protein
MVTVNVIASIPFISPFIVSDSIIVQEHSIPGNCTYCTEEKNDESTQSDVCSLLIAKAYQYGVRSGIVPRRRPPSLARRPAVPIRRPPRQTRSPPLLRSLRHPRRRERKGRYHHSIYS